MIKSDNWLINNGSNIFHPFYTDQINPASYDLKLDNRFINLHDGKTFTADEVILKPPTFVDGIFIPGTAILASTWEYIKIPDDVAGALFLKSSMARLGLDHALAGWIDPGFEGNLTLELHAHREIKLEAGQRVVQIVLYTLDWISKSPYQGKYKGQVGPTKAK